MDRDTRKTLDEIFGGSGTVLTTPSSISDELVLKLAEEFVIDPILRDLGAVAAREFANAIEALALRPADYASLEGVGDTILKRIQGALGGRCGDIFVEALADNLRNRG